MPSSVKIKILGDYSNNTNLFNLLSKVIIPRILKLRKFITKKNHTLLLSAAWHASVASVFLKPKSIMIIDDPRRILKRIWAITATEIYLPFYKKVNNKFRSYEFLKEWSYLSPEIFKPNINALKTYNLESKSYIFIRDISVKSSNYAKQNSNSILDISYKVPKDIPVILSLEDKSQRNKYPSHWKILEEPVDDIYSLMYYSKLVISSGDSVAREGAILGVESLYVGVRAMYANDIMNKLGKLQKLYIKDLPYEIIEKFYNPKPKNSQENFRNYLNNNWKNIDSLLYNIINYYV